MVKIGDILDNLKKYVRSETNGGFSREQVIRKNNLKARILNQLKSDMPDIAERIGVSDFDGLGYFSCYSDFKVTFDGIALFGIATHEPTTKTAFYNAEYLPELHEVMDKQFSGANWKEMSVETAVQAVSHCRKEKKMIELWKQITQKSSELNQLINQLKELQEN